MRRRFSVVVELEIDSWWPLEDVERALDEAIPSSLDVDGLRIRERRIEVQGETDTPEVSPGDVRAYASLLHHAARRKDGG